MRWIIALILLLSGIDAFSETNNERISSIKELKRFVFGSCNNQHDPQPLWAEMAKVKPDFFIWGGDNVYADKQNKNLKAAFDKQNLIPEYINFKKRFPFIGIWDDHDYATNNANGHYAYKDRSQKLLLDFLEEPLHSPRRKRPGVYTSYTFGKTKFILLDNRYFLDVEPNAPMLGGTQWQWLEEELKRSTSKLTFIMSGLSILSPVHPFSDGSWANYPTERDRLLELVEKHRSKGVVFLTGDMHFSSIFHRRGHLEFMSSGMTHTVPQVLWWYLGRRYETSFFGLNYGQVDIQWEGATPLVTMMIRDRFGNEYHKKTFRFEKDDWFEAPSISE